MYTVRWKRTALDRLAELWMEASDRSAINTAVDEVDQLLSSQPLEAGESRPDGIRILFCPPLGVFYDVDELSNTVHVLRVWTF